MTNVDEIIHKARKFQYANGLMELMLGIFMLISAMALELFDNPLISGAVALIGILLAAKFFAKLQMQVSIPRAGYARYPEEAGKGHLWNALTAMGSTVVILGLFFWLLYIQPSNALAWLTLMVGAVIGLVLLAQGIRLRLWRLAFHGVLSLAIGVTLSPIILGTETTSEYTGFGLMSVYFFLMGISLAVSGWIMLSRFVKSHPIQREVNDG